MGARPSSYQPTERKRALLHSIAQRRARIAVIGLGYVGLPVAVGFAEAGFRVVGIDLDSSRAAAVNRGESYVTTVSADRLAKVVGPARGSTREREGRRNAQGSGPHGSLAASESFEALNQVDAVLICVPTPLAGDRPDMSHIMMVSNEVCRRTRDGLLLVLESTAYPGFTEELLLPSLRGSDERRKVGEDFFVAFSPERIDPGRSDWTLRNTPKIVSGVTPACLDVATALYRCLVETVVPVSSTAVAEVAKLLENTFRAVNIALANEMAIICSRLGVDVWKVVDAAATKPFGFMPFYPGPGVGGHCIPVDPHFLSWKLRTLDYQPRLTELAEEINGGMPRFLVSRIREALAARGKTLRGSVVLLLGTAYKPNVADVRGSPSLAILQLLLDEGARVAYNDPYLPSLAIRDRCIESSVLDDDLLLGADCVVITTAHDSYDWEWVLERSRLVIDTRNVASGAAQATAELIRL